MAKKRVDIEVREKGAKKAQAGFKSLGTSVAKTAASFVGVGLAISGVTRLISSAIEKYKVQELAEKKLTTALGRRSQALLDQASALQKVTSVGDETIIGVQASIAAFTKNEKQIKDATAASLDMAAALGIDLKSAGDLVAKTLGSTTNALTRYGVQVKGAVGSNERLESLVKGIADLWGGQASAQADTLSGRVDHLSNSFGDLLETMVDVSGVAEDDGFLKGLSDIIDGVNQSLKNETFFKTFIGGMMSAGNAVNSLQGGINALTVEGYATLKDTVEETTKKIEKQIPVISDAEKKYISYVNKIEEAKSKQIEQIEFQARYNKEHVTTIQNLDEIAKMESNIIKLAPEGLKLIDVPQVDNIIQASEAFNILQTTATDAALNAGPMLADAFVNQWNTGENALKSFGKAFKQMILQMVAQLAANTLIFTFFSLLNPGGAIAKGGLTSFLGFADGGSPPVGKPSVVGENGPELFVPNVAGNIIPNDKLGQNITVNITGNVMSRDFVEDQVIPQIQTAIRRAG